jgi:hypothetical protein
MQKLITKEIDAQLRATDQRPLDPRDFAADQTPPRDHERDRQLIDARIHSPKRSTTPQQDVNDCPLFVAANEPRLI